MRADDLVVLSLPFFVAAVLQLLQGSIRMFAARCARHLQSVPLQDDAPIVKHAVDLAVHVFLQLSYLFAIVMSSVSAMAVAFSSPRPMFGLVGAASLVACLAVWAVRWQGLSAVDLEGRAAFAMRTTAWLAIVGQWALALYVRLA